MVTILQAVKPMGKSTQENIAHSSSGGIHVHKIKHICKTLKPISFPQYIQYMPKYALESCNY